MSESRRPPFVVLGVTGGIAAYKAVEICRLLVDAGVHVAPVLTKDAAQFITPLTFSALASEPAQTELYNGVSPIPHTRLGQAADLILVAPATANLLGRLALGLADDLLTNTLLASRAQVVVAPAMHTEMWEQQSVQENIETLRVRGVRIVGPSIGRLAGGDEGAGRMEDPSVIVEAVLTMLHGADNSTLTGRRIVISAGGTREAIDPVRVITNRSSGKQGHALAEVAMERGAEVTLVTSSSLGIQGKGSGSLSVVKVESAAQMHDAMLQESKDADIVIMAAAVADFRPVLTHGTKVKKESGHLEVTFEPTEDILAALVHQRGSEQVIVGFAAETDNVLENARKKLAKKGCDLLVVNDVSAEETGFEHDTNEVVIIESNGNEMSVPMSSKRTIAGAILDSVVRSMKPSSGESKT
jgi:phosphopantothenoylcysteine decarboxylase / phosphopantothenate---cysteine ligase